MFNFHKFPRKSRKILAMGHSCVAKSEGDGTVKDELEEIVSKCAKP
jgi:hypothetical protein